MKGKVGVCYIVERYNNIFGVLLNEDGKVEAQVSSGIVKMLGPKKKTALAGELVGREVGRRAYLKNYRRVHVKIKGGVSKRVRGVVNGLEISGIKVFSLELVRNIAHAGVRPKKRRR